MSLTGKVVLVTGASKGIGKAVAERFARDGASVVINFASDSAAADSLVAQIGVDWAMAVQADVSKIVDIERLVGATVEKFGHIDVVVANAGIMPMRDTASTTEADFDDTFALNVKGPYFLVQKAVPYMPAGGRIILVSSGVCHLSAVQPGYLLYGATKGAIEQMTRIMAKDLARKGIIVNAIAPGPTGTELFFKGKNEQVIDGVKRLSPFNRLGSPEEIASVAAFLSGPDSTWVAGQIVMANGANMV